MSVILWIDTIPWPVRHKVQWFTASTFQLHQWLVATGFSRIGVEAVLQYHYKNQIMLFGGKLFGNQLTSSVLSGAEFTPKCKINSSSAMVNRIDDTEAHRFTALLITVDTFELNKEK